MSVFAESISALHFLSPLHRKRKQGTLFSYPYMFYTFRQLQDALEQRRHLTVEQQSNFNWKNLNNPVGAAAIATWCISSRQLGPPRISQSRTAPRRCSHGYCSLWDVGPSWRYQFSRCCCYPFCRSAGYWRRCPSHRWSSRRRLRFLVWSLTQTLGPWRISPDPRRSTPENNRFLEKYFIPKFTS